MKRLFAITVVLLLSSAMVFVVPSVAGDPVTRPLKIMWTGIVYVMGPSSACPAGSVLAVNIGKGVSTVSGESDWFSGVCLEPVTASSLAGSGWGILTAANGDRLHTSVEVTVDLGKNPVEWSETEFAVGGTGRFEGATGSTDSHGTWTSGTDLFPSGSSIAPLPFQEPHGWVGTSEGEITF